MTIHKFEIWCVTMQVKVSRNWGMYCWQILSIELSFHTILNLPQHQFMHTFSWLEKWPVDFLISQLIIYLYFWSCVKMVHGLLLLSTYSQYWLVNIWKIPWALAGVHCSTPRMPADSCLDTALSLKQFFPQR